jgi:hypothetical protein
MMEETFVKVEELADNLKEYAEIRVEEVRLKVAERSSGLIANLMAGLFVRVGVVLSILFAGLALAFFRRMVGTSVIGLPCVSDYLFNRGLDRMDFACRYIRIPMMNSILRHLTKRVKKMIWNK